MHHYINNDMFGLPIVSKKYILDELKVSEIFDIGICNRYNNSNYIDPYLINGYMCIYLYKNSISIDISYDINPLYSVYTNKVIGFQFQDDLSNIIYLNKSYNPIMTLISNRFNIERVKSFKPDIIIICI